jgi:DNA polymerase-1
MRQAGTDTGRFSYSDPNLQNVPKEESGTWRVRRAFRPTAPEWCLVMIDYAQMEYRLMLDYAGQMDVIRKILEEGLDVHQATSTSMDVDRTSAKTLNFMLLYGGGTAKLAAALGISIEKAGQLKHRYFKRLEKIRAFSRNIINKAEGRHFVFNWAGRVCHFPEVQTKKGPDRLAFRAPNHVIQGGCADVVKRAMVRCHEFLRAYSSRMLLQVHDEIVFEVHRSELDIVPELRKIMETAYPHRHLPLTCDVEHSWTSWGDKVKGYPEIPQ